MALYNDQRTSTNSETKMKKTEKFRLDDGYNLQFSC